MARNSLNQMLETVLRIGRNFCARTVAHAVHVLGFAATTMLILSASARAEDSQAEPRFSLVVGVAETWPSDVPAPCPPDRFCVDMISFGSFKKATALAGPDLGDSFGAQIVTHTRMRGQPLLMLVEHLDNDNRYVIDYARGPTDGGQACLRDTTFHQIAWQPRDDAIIRKEGLVCAEVPSGGYAYGEQIPVASIGPQEAARIRAALKSTDTPRASITKPKDEWGDLYLVVMDLQDGKRHPENVYVPDDCRTDGEPVPCLYGSIIVHPIEGAEVIAATTKRRFNTDYPRLIHTPGPHAASGAFGSRVVALAERSDKGYWWVPWKSAVDHGKACVPKRIVDEFAIDFGGRAVSERDGESCFVI